jgi:hypothetical protein
VKKSTKVLEYHNRFWDLLRHDEDHRQASPTGAPEPAAP